MDVAWAPVGVRIGNVLIKNDVDFYLEQSSQASDGDRSVSEIWDIIIICKKDQIWQPYLLIGLS